MTMRPLEDQFVKKRGGTMKMRYETCVATADTDGTIIFGMDDTGCWRSTAASQHSYDSLGSSKECKKRGSYHTGRMESNAVFVYEKKGGNKCYIGKILSFPDFLVSVSKILDKLDFITGLSAISRFNELICSTSVSKLS